MLQENSCGRVGTTLVSPRRTTESHGAATLVSSIWRVFQKTDSTRTNRGGTRLFGMHTYFHTGTWPDRIGEVTPVHVFSSGDEAELFVNGESQGRQRKAGHRFRWDNVTYEPGEVHVKTYKDGEDWAEATVRTTGEANQLRLSTYQDRTTIAADGSDLCFVRVAVSDDNDAVVHTAEPAITFSVTGPGEIVSTDNGDATDFTPFPSKERNASRGLALAIVRAKAGASEPITVTTAQADGLKTAELKLDIGDN